MARASRRADVRATAARLFRQHGYTSATMDMLADEVGLNKGTLYHYYPSKSAILFELLSEQVDATNAATQKVVEDATPTERFRELVRLQVQLVANSADELVVFFQELPWMEKNLSAEQATTLRKQIDTYRKFVQSILDEGMASGEFRDLDVAIIHNSIVGILAYIPAWFRARSGRTQAALVDEVADFVMAGIAAAPGRGS